MRVHALHPGGLAGSELEHAGVVRVVHEVKNRVYTGITLAGVAPGRAPERREPLCRRVVDVIVVRVASALERVVQAEPVARLVRGRVAFVVGAKEPCGSES